jgi:cytochrome P450
MRHDIPQPPGSGIRNALRFGDDAFRFLEGIQARFEDVVEVPIPGRPPLVFVTSPTLARDVLSRPAEFGRPPATGPARLLATQGLVQSEGDLWRRQRALMRPAFVGPRVVAYADTAGDRVAALADEWRDRLADRENRDGTSGLRVNLHREMTTLTIRVASEILLGEDAGRERAEQFYEWMQVAGREFEFGPESVQPAWLPARTSREFREAAAGMRAFAEELIDRRRAALADAGGSDGTGGPTAVAGGDDDPPRDMLSLLLRAEAEGVEMAPTQIRDEVMTFLIAGHETTALSLSFALSLLSWHPEVRTAAREEARRVLGDATPRHAHVADLPTVDRVLRETLRLYPPAWAVFRRATAEVRLGDYRVRRGSAVVVPLWSIQRDDRYFEAADEFDPDRWLRRSPSGVEAYLPFSVGPHACIGQQFAVTGATLVLAGLVREFDADVPADGLDDLRATPTLRPGSGVPATVRRVA